MIHRRGMMGAKVKSLRVFVGPVEIAGYYSGLAAALRELGVDAVSVDLTSNAFRYVSRGIAPWPVRLATATTTRLNSTRERSARWYLALALDLVARATVLAWTMWRFDVYIFGFGETFLAGRELPLLRLTRKRLIFVFNGSDARPTYVDGAVMAESRHLTVHDAVQLARQKKRRIQRIERSAHVIVSQPAFSHFFERPVVDFFRIGHPWTATEHASEAGPRDASTIRILHSPSHPEAKGSARIRRTIEKLRAAGHPLELIELQGVSNHVVRSEIARADFVIDQLYSDAPMVGFATEAATAGRPAIVGGYVWPDLDAIYPGDSMPPVEACHPDDLAEAIVRLATNPDHRSALGERARNFVNTQWAPAAVAKRYLALIKGEIDASWLFDPRQLRYTRGVGLTEDRARALVAGVLAVGGRAALQLADKPQVEQAFVDFAEGR